MADPTLVGDSTPVLGRSEQSQQRPVYSCAAGSSNELPKRAGVGLKPQHFQEVLASSPDIGFFEVHAENYMVDGGPFHHFLGRIRERYPLSIHGVGLSLGGESALDEEHLRRLVTLLDRYEPAAFSEHLAWSGHGGMFLNDLLPIAYNRQSLARVSAHIEQVQDRLRRRILLENPSTYLEFVASTMDEPLFLQEIVQRTGCGLLLDITNVYVSCANHGWDASTYIDKLPLHAVEEIHLAGFSRDSSEDGLTLLIDSHCSPVGVPDWQLFRELTARVGAMPTLIERDANVPPLAELQSEAHYAERLMHGVNAQTLRAQPQGLA